jgi:hypothetical protein
MIILVSLLNVPPPPLSQRRHGLHAGEYTFSQTIWEELPIQTNQPNKPPHKTQSHLNQNNKQQQK